MRRRDFIAGVGSAAAWPVVARGQQSAIPVIGLLSDGTQATMRPVINAFQRGLAQSGYTEGQNVEFVYRFMEGQHDRLPKLISELIDRRVAVIVAVGGNAPALAASLNDEDPSNSVHDGNGRRPTWPCVEFKRSWR